MLFGVRELQLWPNAYQAPDGNYYAARPLWNSWGRWRHAWWVLTGRCDAVWWPQDGNPYWRPTDPEPPSPGQIQVPQEEKHG